MQSEYASFRAPYAAIEVDHLYSSHPNNKTTKIDQPYEMLTLSPRTNDDDNNNKHTYGVVPKSKGRLYEVGSIDGARRSEDYDAPPVNSNPYGAPPNAPQSKYLVGPSADGKFKWFVSSSD